VAKTDEGEVLKFIGQERDSVGQFASLQNRILCPHFLQSPPELRMDQAHFFEDSPPLPNPSTGDVELAYIFKRMAMEDLDEVVQTPTTIVPCENASGSSVYVRPEARGIAVVRKELEVQFVHWKFVVTYVSSANNARIAGSSKGLECGLVSISTGIINCEFLLFLFLFFSVARSSACRSEESQLRKRWTK